MQQSIPSADFIPLVRKIPYLCFDNPVLRKGSAITPGMLLQDKLDILEWELKRAFITTEDLLNAFTPVPRNDVVDELFNALRELKGLPIGRKNH